VVVVVEEESLGLVVRVAMVALERVELAEVQAQTG
jgi:hypothetical protein